MPFPDAPRVIYKNNPLDRVICQLKFPPILKIEKEIPAEFQEQIRGEFPGFREKEEAVLAIPQELQSELPGELLRQAMPTRNKNYEFSSEDGIWTVNLTRTFVALTTKKYGHRDEFQRRLSSPLEALLNIYKPAYFSRIGLRYIDIFRRSVLHLTNVAWGELLEPYVLGLLGSSDVNQDIQAFESKYEILLDDKRSIARIVTGLAEYKEDKDKDKEECFMVDTDFYDVDKTETTAVKSKLNYFHTHASRLIRWLITKRLHEAMEPMEPESL
jgi:uncharacterized protein (TIGR04255 family)